MIRVNGLPSAHRRSGLVGGVGVRWTTEGKVNSEQRRRTLRFEDMEKDGAKAKTYES